MNSDIFRKTLEIKALEEGMTLDSHLADRLQAYFDLLAHWNERINLTSLPLDPPTEQTVERLVIEPLRAVPLLSPHVSLCFDLGSGGGSPAIPLQLAKPSKRLVMVESRDRKAAFLREVVRELGISGAEVEVARIEAVARNHRSAGVADLVTVRAVKIAASLFADIQLLLRFGGQVALFGAKVSELALPRGFDIEPAASSGQEGVILLRRAGL